MKTYRFSEYTRFTEKEIDQIISLVRDFGRSIPIDRRRYSRNVLRWAISFDLVYDGSKQRWPDEKPGKLYINSRFDIYYLPIIALWKLVDPIIGKSTGYSISTHKEWEGLNIYPTSSKFHSSEDFRLMNEVLCRLDQYHFIIFQSAGSVWAICRRPENEWITDQF